MHNFFQQSQPQSHDSHHNSNCNIPLQLMPCGWELSLSSFKGRIQEHLHMGSNINSFLFPHKSRNFKWILSGFATHAHITYWFYSSPFFSFLLVFFSHLLAECSRVFEMAARTTTTTTTTWEMGQGNIHYIPSNEYHTIASCLLIVVVVVLLLSVEIKE